MLTAGVLCVGAAVASAAFGLWALMRPSTGDPIRLVRRAVAPAQLAAALMLGAGGAVALVGPPGGALVVIVCIVGAVGTVLAGSWQGARFAAHRRAGVSQRSDARQQSGCGCECGCAKPAEC